jgi:uncharacterized protein YdeI (YjbR/CyaY-like superfamily)
MIHPRSRAELRAWLDANHARSDGTWIADYKKASGKPQLGYGAIVEELIAFGWVDSKSRSLDEERTLLWAGPRRPRSAWSESNRERVARLEAAGTMTDAGRAAVRAAKEAGTW